MARLGIYNRNDNSATPVPRSLQNLSHRFTGDVRAGQITPTAFFQLLPNETIRFNVSNFVRTIPMKTPQLSRVKVVTRCIAVPNRLTWFGFEEYIDGVKDSQFTMTEPYVINFNTCRIDEYLQSRAPVIGTDLPYYFNAATTVANKAAFATAVRSHNASVKDFSVLGLGYDGRNLSQYSSYAYARCVRLFEDVCEIPDSMPSMCGYQFFPHELGDYFNEPLFTASLATDVGGRISAYHYAAYQLAYSYFYRQANVQTRIDDFYQMGKQDYEDQRFAEFSSYYQLYNQSDKVFTPPISAGLSWLSEGGDAMDGFNPSAVNEFSAVNPLAVKNVVPKTDWSKDSSADSVLRTSWSSVEHFPLKGGANLTMQAMDFSEDGTPRLKSSRISLTRLRFANWQSDRFTTANPWQQRGDEAQIPVVGSVDFSANSFTFEGTTERVFVTSKFNVPATGIRAIGNGTESDEYAVLGAGSFTLDPNDSAEESIRYYNDSGETLDMSGAYLETAPVSLDVTSSGYYTPKGVVRGNISGSLSGLYVSPSSFRFAMQLQKIKEMSARTDGRFKSFLSMFYGAKSRDARLDRPEFIGGSVQQLDISEIAQTAPGSDSVVGELAGRGISSKKSSTFSYHASEHTIILVLTHIIPDTEYIGGLDRTHHYTSPFDWAMPQFAGLSEQPIRNAELALLPTKFDETTNSDNDITFGFEPRFNELRAKHSFAVGAFRDVANFTGSRDYYEPWLVTRKFGLDFAYSVNSSNQINGLEYVVPTLSDEFLSMRHTVDNSNFEVTDESVMYPYMLDTYFNIRWTRVVPSRGIPRI